MKPNASVKFEIIRGRLSTWSELFAKAADFATRLGHDRVISISHSEDADDGVVAVWYWEISGNAADRPPLESV